MILENESASVPAKFFSFNDINGNPTTPWHGNNTMLNSDPYDLIACLKEAGEFYEVEKHALVDPIHNRPMKSVFGLYRNDTKEFINTCGAGFNGQGPQNILSPIHEMMVDQGIKINSFASWSDGLFVINYDFGESEIVKGDTHKNFFQVVFANNTLFALTEFVSSIRAVCKNTVSHSLNSATAKFKTKSTKNMLNRLDEAAKLVGTLKESIGGIEDRLRFLASKQVSNAMLDKILTNLYGETKLLKDGSVKETSMREKVIRAFENNDGNLIPGIRGSYYNVYNALTNVHTHDDGLVRLRGEVEESERPELVRAKKVQKNLFGNSDVDKFFKITNSILN